MHVHIDVGNILPNERTLSHQILIQSGPSDSLDTWQHVPQSLPYLPLFLPLLFLFISLPSSFPCFFSGALPQFQLRGSEALKATSVRSWVKPQPPSFGAFWPEKAFGRKLEKRFIQCIRCKLYQLPMKIWRTYPNVIQHNGPNARFIWRRRRPWYIIHSE